MLISLYANKAEFPNYRAPISSAVKAKPAVGAPTGNYDKATFNKQPAPAGESEPDFARILARETAARIEQSDSQEKVAALQQQVAAGAYQPNARTIAEHMLNYR